MGAERDHGREASPAPSGPSRRRGRRRVRHDVLRRRRGRRDADRFDRVLVLGARADREPGACAAWCSRRSPRTWCSTGRSCWAPINRWSSRSWGTSPACCRPTAARASSCRSASRARIGAAERPARLVRRAGRPAVPLAGPGQVRAPGRSERGRRRRRCRQPPDRHARVLRELHISGLGVIDDLDLDLHPGLNVLTGETGRRQDDGDGGPRARAGRASRQLARPRRREGGPRPGAVRCHRARGRVGGGRRGPARPLGERRREERPRASGGSSPRRPRSPSSARRLVEVHGQHQAQRLLSPATQTGFLDRFAGDAHLVVARRVPGDVGALARRADGARRALRRRRASANASWICSRTRCARSSRWDPLDGETERLTARRPGWRTSNDCSKRSTEAEATLSGDGSIGDAAAGAANALDRRRPAGSPRGGRSPSERESLATELAELARDVRDYREGLSADPDRLQEIRERLSA